MSEAPTPFDPHRPPEQELEPHIDDGFTLAAVGDCIISRAVSPLLDTDPAFAGVVANLWDATVAVGNLETSIVDVRSFRGHLRTADDWDLCAAPEVAGDLAALGFDLMSRANNHALDWGFEGLRETGRRIDDVGIVHAGTGELLAHARAPQYVQTEAGRVGFVSMYSCEPYNNDAALDAFGQMPGRPGVSALRVQRVAAVPEAVLEGVRAVYRATYPDLAEAEPEGFRLFETKWVRAEDGSTSVTFEMNGDDVVEILRAIRLGKQHSDLMIAAIHCHDEGPDADTPPAFLVELAHAAIDAGADVFVGHGVHRLWPVEIYRGKPIAYGLGNFFWSDIAEPTQKVRFDVNRAKLEAVFGRTMPTDADLNLIMNAGDFADARYFESAVAVVEVAEGQPRLRLHPFDLGYGLPLTRSGLPRVPEPEKAEAILGRMSEISAPLGTQIRAEGGVGFVS